jgi:hypothetical protein
VTYFHEEQRFRQWWIWVLLAVAAVPLLVVVAIRGPALTVLLGPLLLLAVGALLAFARLVVDVDGEAITVAFHFLWPKRRIPLADVRSAKATTYRPILDYGCYGVRLGFRGWAFNVSGDEGVLVETNNGSRLMIGSQRAKQLEAAIARAMHGESSGDASIPR